MRLLLVEDDKIPGDGIVAGLREFSYSIDWIPGDSPTNGLQVDVFFPHGAPGPAKTADLHNNSAGYAN